ncbi:hypothetical protein LY90DRAFT_8776 [Neocallimastix californiae]|uniref:S-adenosyl-L-methionine-dependent methyltransferase n=1 Tax=Neocallimastix californiae TaxID=1754190 RepID=A0A1Y2CLU6_9FUNG|nr:hypothetical protein LY90DRAFT_8776 [Neocallimastix californiae]|eukprot:ORY47970.1 hypothetical protein LY90DRAFT_8776 [Neocallimastix californiae]
MDKGIKRKNNDNTNNEDNITDNNKIKKSKSNLTNKENDLETESLRILEFFCGIGGMHYAFEQSGMKGVVVASFDINTVTNSW